MWSNCIWNESRKDDCKGWIINWNFFSNVWAMSIDCIFVSANMISCDVLPYFGVCHSVIQPANPGPFARLLYVNICIYAYIHIIYIYISQRQRHSQIYSTSIMNQQRYIQKWGGMIQRQHTCCRQVSMLDLARIWHQLHPSVRICENAKWIAFGYIVLIQYDFVWGCLRFLWFVGLYETNIDQYKDKDILRPECYPQISHMITDWIKPSLLCFGTPSGASLSDFKATPLGDTGSSAGVGMMGRVEKRHWHTST